MAPAAASQPIRRERPGRASVLVYIAGLGLGLATPRDDVTTLTEDPQYIAKRKKCCEDGRQHFYTNGNCANMPQKENEAVGLWCDRKFLQCCSFMEAYYMGPVDGCRNKPCNSRLPSPTDTSRVTDRPLN